MESDLNNPELVELSEDEDSFSQKSVASEQGSTADSVNSRGSVTKSKFASHFVYLSEEKRFKCNYCR